MWPNALDNRKYWVGAVIGAAGAIGGDLLSQSGQKATNAAMLQQNRDIMQWETEMSNTAMTRRAADLKTAGFNPLLAVNQGGASTPSVGAVPLQNPNQAFGNLGSQVTGALQAAQAVAQTKNVEADTKSKEIDNIRKDPRAVFSGGALGVDASGAPARISPAQVEYNRSVTGAQSASEALKTQQFENQKLANYIDNIMPADTQAAQMDAKLKTDMLPVTMQTARAQAQLLADQVPGADAQAAMMRGPFGKYVPYLDEVAKSVGIASGFMGLVRQFMPR